MKHTPAPWKMVKHQIQHYSHLITKDGKTLAEVVRYHDEHEVNARLIACAPDYFAIVEAVLEDETLSAEHIRNMLRPAHAKAKGE